MVVIRNYFLLIITAVILITGFQNCAPVSGSGDSASSASVVYPANPIPDGAQAQTIATGIQFGEGPVYAPALGSFLFSDISQNKTFQWNATTGITTFRDNTNGANGNILDRSGNVIECTLSGLVKINPITKQVTNLTQPQAGITYVQPNDLALFKDDSVYFTDYAGGKVYRVTAAGVTNVMLSSLIYPNGIKFSPDFSRLYISFSGVNQVLAFNVDSRGSLTYTGIFHDAPDNVGSPADGLAIDMAGNVYITGQDAVTILNPSGTEVGSIPIGDTVTNLAFGGVDYKTLFITSKTAVRQIQMLIPGVH